MILGSACGPFYPLDMDVELFPPPWRVQHLLCKRCRLGRKFILNLFVILCLSLDNNIVPFPLHGKGGRWRIVAVPGHCCPSVWEIIKGTRKCRSCSPQARQFDFYIIPEVKGWQAALSLKRKQKPLVCCYRQTDLLVVGFFPQLSFSHPSAGEVAVPRSNLPGTGLELNPVFSQPLGNDSSSLPSCLHPFRIPPFPELLRKARSCSDAKDEQTTGGKSTL